MATFDFSSKLTSGLRKSIMFDKDISKSATHEIILGFLLYEFAKTC